MVVGQLYYLRIDSCSAIVNCLHRHFVGGIALWRKKAWAYLLAILLAFAAFMTFIALSIALLLLYFSFGQGSALDIAITIGIALVATGFSLVIFKRVKD